MFAGVCLSQRTGQEKGCIITRKPVVVENNNLLSCGLYVILII